MKVCTGFLHIDLHLQMLNSMEERDCMKVLRPMMDFIVCIPEFLNCVTCCHLPFLPAQNEVILQSVEALGHYSCSLIHVGSLLGVLGSGLWFETAQT